MPKQTVQQAVTSASEWRAGREQGVIFHFPSGLTARVRPINAGAFINMGKIPDTLVAIVERALRGDIDPETLTLEEIGEMHQVYDIFSEAAFVSPRIVKKITDPETQITAEDVSDVDKQTLFQFIGSPASLLASFRPTTPDNVDDMVGQSGDAASAE